MPQQDKSVCMFVWNMFTNDARVMRECTTLTQAGYKVSLICIRGKGQPYLETVCGFSVYRVEKEFPLVTQLFGLHRRLLRHKPLLALCLLLAAAAASGLWLLNPVLSIVFAALYILFFAAYACKVPAAFNKLGAVLRMMHTGRRMNADIYHANDLNTLPQACFCARFRRGKKAYLVYDSHEVQTSRTGYSKNVYYIERHFIRWADLIFCENETRAAYMRSLYPVSPKPLYNYPNYYDCDARESEKIDLRALLDIPSEEPILLYQGGIQYGRGLDKLVEAAPLFQKGIVVFIGSGRFKPELEELIRSKGVEKRVRLLPKVPLSELPRYTMNGYLGFQVLNNTCFNHYSAASNKLFEYIMAGVPVVASGFPEFKKVIEESGAGLLVDSSAPASIAGAVNRQTGDEALRESMAVACRKAAKRYNWENQKDYFLKAYSEIGKGR